MEIASIRHSVGNANRGKKFDDARINKMHAHRPPSSYGHPQSEERKIQIGKESSERWKDPIFRKCVIEKGSATKEAKGLIVPRKYLTSWKFYWREANWISGFIYCKEKNLHLKGLCRDHIVGRKQGFLLGIFPEILRHPLNCQVITLSENSKKARNTADEKQPDILIEKILNYMGNYPQHEHAKFLAEEYLKGKRWKHEQNLV